MRQSFLPEQLKNLEIEFIFFLSERLVLLFGFLFVSSSKTFPSGNSDSG
jgi:hypothetical protein